MSAEQWRPIPEWEGLYDVSDQGRVKSLARVIHQTSRWGKPMTRRWPERLLQPVPVGNGGYLAVTLSVGREAILPRVSRLVLLVFVGPPPGPEYEAAHGNGDRHDNRLANLRWATPMENSADRVLHGTSPVGERNPAARLTRHVVAEIRAKYAAGARRADLVAQYAVSASHLDHIVQRTTWRHVD